MFISILSAVRTHPRAPLGTGPAPIRHDASMVATCQFGSKGLITDWRLTMRITPIVVASGAMAAVALAGCRTYHTERVVTQPANPVVVQTPAPSPVVVATAPPPAPRAETVPLAPSPDSIWVPGYWSWVNGQYQWVPGRYEAGRVGYTWVPQRWEYINGQWQMTGGTWVRQ